MDTKLPLGHVVTLKSAAGLIERIVISDLGDVVTVCKKEEFEAAKSLMRQPVTVGFKKADVHR